MGVCVTLDVTVGDCDWVGDCVIVMVCEQSCVIVCVWLPVCVGDGVCEDPTLGACERDGVCDGVRASWPVTCTEVKGAHRFLELCLVPQPSVPRARAHRSPKWQEGCLSLNPHHHWRFHKN